MTEKSVKKPRYGLFSREGLNATHRKIGGPFSHFGEYRTLDEDRITSAWVQVKPCKPVMLSLIFCDDRERTLSALHKGAATHQCPVFEVDVPSWIQSEGPRFIRGKITLDVSSMSSARCRPTWHKGEGVYVFNNLSWVIHASERRKEFLGALYAMRVAELASSEEIVDAVDLGCVSLCSLVSQEEWEVIWQAHQRSRFPFSLIKKVDMEF